VDRTVSDDPAESGREECHDRHRRRERRSVVKSEGTGASNSPAAVNAVFLNARRSVCCDRVHKNLPLLPVNHPSAPRRVGAWAAATERLVRSFVSATGLLPPCVGLHRIFENMCPAAPEGGAGVSCQRQPHPCKVVDPDRIISRGNWPRRRISRLLAAQAKRSHGHA